MSHSFGSSRLQFAQTLRQELDTDARLGARRVTGRGYMDVNRISGYIPGKMVFFLMQVGSKGPRVAAVCGAFAMCAGTSREASSCGVLICMPCRKPVPVRRREMRCGLAAQYLAVTVLRGHHMHAGCNARHATVSPRKQS